MLAYIDLQTRAADRLSALEAVAIAYAVKREAAKKKKGHNALRDVAR
jgi:hypothetical protein